MGSRGVSIGVSMGAYGVSISTAYDDDDDGNNEEEELVLLVPADKCCRGTFLPRLFALLAIAPPRGKGSGGDDEA